MKTDEVETKNYKKTQQNNDTVDEICGQLLNQLTEFDQR
jgi:hypothetical protein